MYKVERIETGMTYFGSVCQGEICQRKVLKKVMKKEIRCGCGCLIAEGSKNESNLICPYCFSKTQAHWKVCLRTYICWRDMDTGRCGECTAEAFLGFCRSDKLKEKKTLEQETRQFHLKTAPVILPNIK